MKMVKSLLLGAFALAAISATSAVAYERDSTAGPRAWSGVFVIDVGYVDAAIDVALDHFAMLKSIASIHPAGGAALFAPPATKERPSLAALQPTGFVGARTGRLRFLSS